MWKVVFYLVWAWAACEDLGPLVSTSLGQMRGYYLETRDKRKIAGFTSIPYAEPPLADLRFKLVKPVQPWEGILNASRESPLCVQRNPYTRQQEIVGQEDCLYLNLYTPKLNYETPSSKDELLPVMVFIHGGGWMCGDSSTHMYGPAYLLDQDVLLVGINYRLGPLGFLSTLDQHCPGNNGLKDQREALKWIQNHIHHFGGNPDSVTIFGESAGGASVHYHMLSPSSSGLFHKAISESGTALVPWAEASPGEPLKNAFKLAKFMDCPQAPPGKMLACLRTKDAYDLIDTEFRFYTWDYEAMTPFKAVVEPEVEGAFLTRSPRERPATPTVPWMTGLTKNEGCLKSVWIVSNSSRLNEFVTGFDAIAPSTFYYEGSPHANEITKVLRELYLDTTDPEELKNNILDAYTDSYFAYPALDAVEKTLEYTENPIYLYELTYRATNSFSQIFGDSEGDYGVCHADELMHLFPVDFLKHPSSPEDVEFSRLLVTLWTNFATSGNPNAPTKVPLKWEPVSSASSLEYLQLGPQQHMAADWAGRSRLWGVLPLWFNKQQRPKDEL